MSIPLTVSTSWAARGPRGLDGTADRVLAVGGRSVELEYRLREREFRKLTAQLRQARLPVRSLHNFCPHPASFDHLPPSGDLFCLSSTDERERTLAVGYTLQTLHHAAELGAEAVVLHLGNVGGDEPETLRAAVDRYGPDSCETAAILRRWLALRAYRARPRLDALRKALDPIVREAERKGLRLGLETRVNLHEIPDEDELSGLLATFGDTVGYWHDTGHAEVRGRFGLPGGRRWLDRFRDRLIGLHLTDVRGWHDHEVPGTGSVDFAGLARRLPDRPLVATLEIGPEPTEAQVREGLAHLVRIGLLEGEPAGVH